MNHGSAVEHDFDSLLSTIDPDLLAEMDNSPHHHQHSSNNSADFRTRADHLYSAILTSNNLLFEQLTHDYLNAIATAGSSPPSSIAHAPEYFTSGYLIERPTVPAPLYPGDTTVDYANPQFLANLSFSTACEHLCALRPQQQNDPKFSTPPTSAAASRYNFSITPPQDNIDYISVSFDSDDDYGDEDHNNTRYPSFYNTKYSTTPQLAPNTIFSPKTTHLLYKHGPQSPVYLPYLRYSLQFGRMLTNFCFSVHKVHYDTHNHPHVELCDLQSQFDIGNQLLYNEYCDLLSTLMQYSEFSGGPLDYYKMFCQSKKDNITQLFRPTHHPQLPLPHGLVDCQLILNHFYYKIKSLQTLQEEGEEEQKKNVGEEVKDKSTHCIAQPYNISLYTACLGNNMALFDFLLTTTQHHFGHVDLSVLYDVLEQENFSLFAALTNNGQKLVDIIAQFYNVPKTYITTSNTAFAKTLEAYAEKQPVNNNNSSSSSYQHITFDHKSVFPTDLETWSHRGHPPLPANPHTGKNVLQLLFQKLMQKLTMYRAEQRKTRCKRTSLHRAAHLAGLREEIEHTQALLQLFFQYHYWASFSQYKYNQYLHILSDNLTNINKFDDLENSAQNKHDNQQAQDKQHLKKEEEDEEEGNVLQKVMHCDPFTYVEQHYPSLIPGRHLEEDNSIITQTNAIPFRMAEIGPEELDYLKHKRTQPPNTSNYQPCAPLVNDFYLSRIAAPIITQYLWLVELLSMDIEHMYYFSQYVIPNMAQLFQQITLKEMYAILLHQNVHRIVNWFFLVRLYHPQLIRDIHSEGSEMCVTAAASLGNDDVDESAQQLALQLFFMPTTPHPPQFFSTPINQSWQTITSYQILSALLEAMLSCEATRLQITTPCLVANDVDLYTPTTFTYPSQFSILSHTTHTTFALHNTFHIPTMKQSAHNKQLTLPQHVVQGIATLTHNNINDLYFSMYPHSPSAHLTDHNPHLVTTREAHWVQYIIFELFQHTTLHFPHHMLPLNPPALGLLQSNDITAKAHGNPMHGFTLPLLSQIAVCPNDLCDNHDIELETPSDRALHFLIGHDKRRASAPIVTEKYDDEGVARPSYVLSVFLINRLLTLLHRHPNKQQRQDMFILIPSLFSIYRNDCSRVWFAWQLLSRYHNFIVCSPTGSPDTPDCQIKQQHPQSTYAEQIKALKAVSQTAQNKWLMPTLDEPLLQLITATLFDPTISLEAHSRHRLFVQPVLLKIGMRRDEVARFLASADPHKIEADIQNVASQYGFTTQQQSSANSSSGANSQILNDDDYFGF